MRVSVRRQLSVTGLLVCAVWISACSPINDGLSAVESKSYIEITPDKTLLWQTGATTQLRAIYYKGNGEPLDPQPQFEWISDNLGAAVVDSGGLVTAIADGEVNISVVSEGIAAKANITVNTGVLVVSGNVRYEDQEYSPSGLGSTAYKNARHILVDLVDGNGNLVQTTSTDADGSYSIGVNGGSDYSIRVISQSSPNVTGTIDISDMSGNLYAASQSLDLLDLSTANVDISKASGLAGAFNIIDIFIASSELVSSMTTAYQPPLSVYWQSGSTYGTYYCTFFDSTYCPQGSGIYVLSETGGDQDEFDDDVLWHEYSHYLAQQMSKDDSPGGCHVITSNDLDMRLSWSEGWGDYFPAAMKAWLRADPARSSILSIPLATSESVYIDTYGNLAAISLDIGSPGGSPYYYASSEVAVAKTLWDVTQQFGIETVWDVMENYLPSVSTPVNLEAFWDGWLQRQSPDATALAAIKTIFSGRHINYTEDAFEADDVKDAGRMLNVGNSETHYLYKDSGSTDMDIVAIDVTAGVTYIVETYDLRNGADTNIKIVDVSNNVLGENDDANPSLYQSYDSLCGVTRVKNNGTALASSVEFTPASSGTAYIYVSTTPDPAPYLSAGRYGTYTLRVTQK